MRAASAKLAKLVERTISDQRRKHGHIVLKQVADRCVTYITSHGGFTAFGISHADIIMALRYLTLVEVKHQAQQGLPENTYGRVLPGAPPVLVQLMRGLPQYIATGEGPGAIWVYTLDATPQEWMMHAELKRLKAEQTLRAVQKPNDIARYLAEFDLA